MIASRAGALLVLLSALTVGSGCYTTRTVRGADLAPLKAELDEGAVLPGKDGPPTRVGPSSLIRFRRRDGSLTRWFPARSLQTGEQGPLLRAVLLPLSAMREGSVVGASPEALALLEQTLPPTGELTRNPDGSAVLHAGSDSLAEWLHRFDLARGVAHDTPLVTERWMLRPEGKVPVAVVHGVDLPKVEQSGVLSVDGLPWEDVAAAEVRNFDGFATWFTVVLSPVWVGGLLLVSAVISPFGEVLADSAISLATAKDPKDQPLLDSEAVYGGVLWTPAYAPPSPEGAHPLFTPSAIRRSKVQPMAWIGLGGELTSGRSSTLLLGAGVRLADLFEVGVGTDSWWADPFGLGEQLPGLPLAPGPSRYQPHVIGFLHLGADFDTEAWRRISLPLAFEVGYGTGGAWQLRFQWGVRLRLFQGVFAGFHPFNPQYTSVPVGGTTSWSFPSFVEVGSTF